MAVFVVVELGGFVVAARVPEDGVGDLGGGGLVAGGGVELNQAEGAIAVVLEEVAAVVGDGVDVVEIVFVIPLHVEF